MKKLSAIFAILVVLFAVTNSFAQPQVTVHVTGGYNLPMSDFKGTIGTDTAGTNYLQKSGFVVGADGKYFLGKKRNVGITLSLGYNSFSSGTYTATNGSTEVVKFNTFTVGLGAEYDFMPKGKVNPFLGVEFTGNFFGGKATFTPSGGTATDFTLNSASRFGFAGNFGADFALSKMIGVVVGLKYNMANLIGKKFDSTNTTANSFSLDDAANGSGTITSKSIGWLSIYGGVSFYFNKPKIMKKK